MHSKSHVLLALVLAFTIATTGCSAQWIKTALQDLPVLTQMALSIATLVGGFASDQQANTADAAVVQNISAQASRDLNLLESLYADYKANPNSGTLQQIQSAIADLNQNLPALLESAHISNPALTTRVTAAVNLILATVNSFAALIPQTATAPAQMTMTAKSRTAAPAGASQKASLPTVKELKAKWNQQVCAANEDRAFHPELAHCNLR